MMDSNLDRFRKDLDRLIEEGARVENCLNYFAFGHDVFHAELSAAFEGDLKATDSFIEALDPFPGAYQQWYSEALPLVKQLLADRLSDFVRLYEKPKGRKEVTHENYRIEDACQGLQTSLGGVVRTDSKAALPLLKQQVAIVRAIKRRFDSSLFDMQQLVQADLYDSELDVARELLKNKYSRAAGAVAGVVLEGHLKQVCDKRSLPKKGGTITVLNDTLKAAEVLEISQYRFIQFLGDIRNKCGHKGTTDPTVEEVDDLIAGTAKVIKTVF